jgi:predicted nucleic acid-binding protein
MPKQPETKPFVYFDTAPLVQLYLYQANLTEQAQQVFVSTEQVIVSYLCLPEFMGAIRGAVQGKGLKKNVAKRIVKEFRESWASFLVLDMPASIFERAAELTEKYSIKASDALHLATFEAFTRENPKHSFLPPIVNSFVQRRYFVQTIWFRLFVGKKAARA